MEPNGTTWTNMEPKRYQKGAQNYIKREPKAAKMEPKAPQYFFYVEKVYQQAIKTTNKNDVQKRVVPGYPGPLGLLSQDCFPSLFLKS